MKSIAILSHKGGVGKTCIAVNIAVYLASKGKNVCLLDNDFHGPSIHTFFKPSAIWINNYLLENEKIESVLQDYSSNLNLPGKLFIGFSDPSANSVQKVIRINESTSFRMLEKLLALKKTIEQPPYEVDYFIIDCSPGAHFTTLNVILATESSLFVVKLSNADIIGTTYMISGLFEQLKSRLLVLANFIPDTPGKASEEKELKLLLESIFKKNLGDKNVEILGSIPIDMKLLNIEYDQALKTLRGQESSRVILTLDDPEHQFSQKIIDIIPSLFGEIDLLKTLDLSEEISIKRLKVFVVGEPLVGKTALYHAISKGEIPDKLFGTVGIDRYVLWERRKGNTLMSVNWWDFAGQYAYRDTHKLFLSQYAFYILVLNIRDSLAKNHAVYWLQSIREKAPNAKILPVLTHYDDVKDKVLGLDSTEDWQRLEVLLSTYKTLDPIKVSNTEGYNIKNVKSVIENTVQEIQDIKVPHFYFELEEYIKECEERIFISIHELLNELESRFQSKSDYSRERIIEILNSASTHGLIQIMELPSNPNIVIFDVDQVNKVISLILDQAKKSKGYMQDIDILDICADFFERKQRRDAAKIFKDLLISINLALTIPERRSSGEITSSLFIPHSAEILSNKQTFKLYPFIFLDLEKKIGSDLAFFSFNLKSFDETLPARLLGHLINYIPYSENNRIWREYKQQNGNLTSLIAVLYDEEIPIVLYQALNQNNGQIILNIYVSDASFEKGLYAAINYALGKYNIEFKLLQTQFMKIDHYSTNSDDLIHRLDQLSKIPSDYLKTIHQAINIINSSPASFIITAGTALEKMFLDLYSEKIGKPEYDIKFWEILKELYEIGVIPRPVKIWADTIRLHRNNCAHSINPISSRDAIIVLEEVLYILEWFNNLLPSK